MKKESHIVLVRHSVAEDEFPRWELVNFAPSQKAADALVKSPVDRDGDPIEVRWDDLFATGLMEIVQPDVMAQKAKLFVVVNGAIVEAPKCPVKGARWLAFWEGDDANGAKMLEQCSPVSRWRVVLALCEALAPCMAIPAVYGRSRYAVRVAKEWALGKASDKDVEAAAKDAQDAKNGAKTESLTYSSYAAFRAIVTAGSASVSIAHLAIPDAAFAIAWSEHGSPVSDFGDAYDRAMREMTVAIRRVIPLPILLRSILGAADVQPPRQNPSRRGSR